MTHSKISRTSVAKVVEVMLSSPDVYRATVYQDERTTVKMTRLHKHDRRSRSASFVLTVGVPNYLERLCIKVLKRAGEPLPVKKVQMKGWPKRRDRKVRRKKK